MHYSFSQSNYGKNAFLFNSLFFILWIGIGTVLFFLSETTIWVMILSFTILITYRLFFSWYVEIIDWHIEIRTVFKKLKIPLTERLIVEYIDNSWFLWLSNLKNSKFWYSTFSFSDSSNQKKISLYFPTYLRIRNSEIVFKSLKWLYYEYSAQKK
jgi:hypothetical protein